MTVLTVNGKSGTVVLKAVDIGCVVPAKLLLARPNTQANVQSVIDEMGIAAGFTETPTTGDPGDPGRAIYFDGLTYLRKELALSTIASSRVFAMSFWIKGQLTGEVQRIMDIGGFTPTGRFQIQLTDVGGLHMTANNSGGSQILGLSASPSQLGIGAGGLLSNFWFWVMLAVDLTDPARRWLRVNRVLKPGSWSTFINDAIQFNTADEVTIGAAKGGSLKGTFAIADLWFTTLYFDGSPASLNKFSIDGLPIDLGAEGQYPMGSPPMVFLSGDPINWHVNKGIGGGFDLINGPFTEVAGPTEVITPPSIDGGIPAHGDGYADYLNLQDNSGSLLALGAASKMVTASIDIRAEDTGLLRQFFTAGGDRLSIELAASDTFAIRAKSAAGSTILTATLASSGLLDGDEHTITFSVDMANNTHRWVAIDGVLQTMTWTTYTDSTIGFSVVGSTVFAGPGGINPHQGDILRVWVALGVYIDASNVSDFYASGSPIALGVNGELPTGTSPTVYLKPPVSTFADNFGTGNSYTEFGALLNGVTW